MEAEREEKGEVEKGAGGNKEQGLIGHGGRKGGRGEKGGGDDKQEVRGVKGTGTYQNHTLTQLFITGCWHATYCTVLNLYVCLYNTC
jgi:hypothetical protein